MDGCAFLQLSSAQRLCSWLLTALSTVDMLCPLQAVFSLHLVAAVCVRLYLPTDRLDAAVIWCPARSCCIRPISALLHVNLLSADVNAAYGVDSGC